MPEEEDDDYLSPEEFCEDEREECVDDGEVSVGFCRAAFRQCLGSGICEEYYFDVCLERRSVGVCDTEHEACLANPKAYLEEVCSVRQTWCLEDDPADVCEEELGECRAEGAQL